MDKSVKRLEERIRRRAGDTDDGNRQSWSSEKILDAINEALSALSDYVGWVTEKAYDPLEDDTSVFELPEDFKSVLSLRRTSSLSSTNEDYLAIYRPSPGDTYFAPDSASARAGYSIAGRKLIVWDGVDESSVLTLAYQGYWPSVEQAGDDLPVDLPLWAIRAIEYYACFYCLQEPGIGQAEEGKYQTRRSSGRPTDNPALEGADWFAEKFHKICDAHSGQDIWDANL